MVNAFYGIFYGLVEWQQLADKLNAAVIIAWAAFTLTGEWR